MKWFSSSSSGFSSLSNLSKTIKETCYANLSVFEFTIRPLLMDLYSKMKLKRWHRISMLACSFASQIKSTLLLWVGVGMARLCLSVFLVIVQSDFINLRQLTICSLGRLWIAFLSTYRSSKDQVSWIMVITSVDLGGSVRFSCWEK